MISTARPGWCDVDRRPRRSMRKHKKIKSQRYNGVLSCIFIFLFIWSRNLNRLIFLKMQRKVQGIDVYLVYYKVKVVAN